MLSDTAEQVSPWAADNTLLRSHLLGDAGMNMPLGENQAGFSLVQDQACIITCVLLG